MRVLLNLFIAGVLLGADPPSPGFAVLELFSSEGCSSCPSAEAAMNKQIADAASSGLPIYCISYHVTVWDTLQTKDGVWKDSFSDGRWTMRQQMYANLRPRKGYPRGSLVTPQFYLNGLPLSDAAFREPIKKTLATAPTATVALTWNAKSGLDYAVTGAGAGNTLVVLVVESGLVSEVKKGENAGKTLKHDNVARWMFCDSLDKATSGTVTMNIPDTIKRDNATAIVFVSSTSDLMIVGASALPFPKATTTPAGTVKAP